MLTPHSCFFRNHRRRDTFTSSIYCFRQRLARKRKPLWKTEKPGAGSQPGWRSVLGSLVGGSPGPVFCRGWRRPWGQRSWDVVALRPPALVTSLSSATPARGRAAGPACTGVPERGRTGCAGWGRRVLGGGILGCPVVLGNAFSSSRSAGRQVSLVPLGSSGSCWVLLPAWCFLPLVDECQKRLPE